MKTILVGAIFVVCLVSFAVNRQNGELRDALKRQEGIIAVLEDQLARDERIMAGAIAQSMIQRD